MLPTKIPSSAVVKDTAKAAVTGKRIAATVSSLVPVFACLLVYIIVSNIALLLGGELSAVSIIIFALFAVLLLVPLMLGSIRFFWRLTADSDDSPSEVFYYFSSALMYKRAVKMTLLIIGRSVLVIFACMLPFIIVDIISNSWIYRFLGTEIPLWAAGLELFKEFLRFTGMLFCLVFLLKYYLVPAIVVMDDNMLLMEAVHISVMISRRSLSSFMGLVLSLVGWVALSFLTIPLIYTAPLFLSCYVIHSRYAIVNYNLSLSFYEKEELSYEEE